MGLPTFLLTRKSVKSEVDGEELNFYPISVHMAFQLKAVGKHVAKLLSILFTKQDKDRTTSQRRVYTSQDLPPDEETVIEAANVEVIRERHARQDQLFDELVDVVLAEENRTILADLIKDSLRDDVPRDIKAGELLESLPLPMLTEILIGIAKANKGVLGPLAAKMGSISAHAIATLQERAEGSLAAESESSQDPQ